MNYLYSVVIYFDSLERPRKQDGIRGPGYHHEHDDYSSF